MMSHTVQKLIPLRKAVFFLITLIPMNTLWNSVIAPETLLGNSVHSFLKGVQRCEVKMNILRNRFFRYV